MGKTILYAITAFLFLSVFYSEGQTVTNTEKISSSSKIKRTQGTNQFANVHCALKDKSGKLWFGTTGEGVYRYDPSAGNGQSFVNFTTKDGLGDNNVWCIYEDKSGELWFGTGNGICRYKHGYSSGTKPFNTLHIDKLPGDTASIEEIWSILQDRTGQFWFGTSNGVYRYDQRKFSSFSTYNIATNKGFHFKHIQSMLEDKSGNIWFVSWNHEGVLCYNPSEPAKENSITHYSRKDGLTDDMVHSILEDKSGNIWVGTRNGGVFRHTPSAIFKTNEKSFIHFTQKEGLGNACVYSIIQDKQGNIWFATEPHGAWRYNPSAEGEGLTNYSKKDGLGNASVFCIVEEKNGKLWFGTRDIGLYSFDGNTFKNYSEQ